MLRGHGERTTFIAAAYTHGASNRAIADSLGITTSTVQGARRSVYGKDSVAISRVIQRSRNPTHQDVTIWWGAWQLWKGNKRSLTATLAWLAEEFPLNNTDVGTDE